MQEPPENELTAAVDVGLPAWLPFQFALKLSLTRKWRSRGAAFVDDVVSRCGLDLDSITARLETCELLADSTFQAAEKFVRTGDPAIHAGLAALISAGLRDDALVDESSYYVSVLTQLEPVHLRLLVGYQDAEHAVRPGVGTLSAKTIGGAVGISVVVAQSAAERLHSLSLLTDRLQGDMVNWAGKDGDSFFRITAAGSELLSFCETSEASDQQ